MKYLKGTIALFAVTLCLSLMGVKATQYTQITKITLPILSGTYESQQVDKADDWKYNQKVKKTYSKDQLTSDGREISGQIKGVLWGSPTTTWRTLPQNSNIDFGVDTVAQGGYKLRLKSNKSLATTATVSINWDLGWISHSPYGIVGSR